jgi:ABC-2 type transport system ATP-binding protein
MSTPAIYIEGLEKIYSGSGRKDPPVHALKPLELNVAEGEIFGLLGPNGAGKTTLVKLLLGIAFPSAGRATLFDRPIGTTASKQLVGYLPENHRYPLYLTGGGVMDYFGKLSGLDSATLQSRAEELLALVNMSDWQHTKVKKYSKGMMQRIGIAQALLNQPKVVFLDEPTDGVDPVGRKEIRDLILRLRAEGMTVFLNSHLLSEVELICDRVAILNKGAIARIGTVKELTDIEQRYRITCANEHAELFSRTIAPFAPKILEDAHAEVEATDPQQLNQLIDALRSEGILITAITPLRQSLEDLFIDVITEEDRAV